MLEIALHYLKKSKAIDHLLAYRFPCCENIYADLKRQRLHFKVCIRAAFDYFHKVAHLGHSLIQIHVAGGLEELLQYDATVAYVLVFLKNEVYLFQEQQDALLGKGRIHEADHQIAILHQLLGLLTLLN